MRQKFYLLLLLLFATSPFYAQPLTQNSAQLFESSLNDGIAFMQSIQSFNEQNILSGDRTQYKRIDSLILTADTGSGVWFNGNRMQYMYDADGRIAEIISGSWDNALMSWNHSNRWRWRIFYNAQNQPDSILRDDRKESNMGWKNDEKESFTFDANGLLLTYEKAYWDSSEILGTTYIYWRPSRQLEYFYDANENDTMIITSFFDFNSWTWGNEEKEGREFDSNNNLIVSHRYEPNGFVGDLRDSMFYDANNNLLALIAYYYDASNVAYPRYQHSWSYIADNRSDTLLYYHWVDSVSDWVIKQRVLNVYDQNLDVDTTKAQEWDESLNIWKHVWIAQVEHDSNWPSNQLLLPYLPKYFLYGDVNIEYQTSMITDMKRDFYDDGQWLGVIDYAHYYSDVTILDANLPKTNNIHIYPNPANNLVSLVFESGTSSRDISNYQIFDTGGKRVLSGVLNDSKTINVAALPQGIYYIRIASQSESPISIPLLIAK